MNVRLLNACGATLVAVLAGIGVSVGAASGASPTGWYAAGSDPKGYELRTDAAEKHDGKTSGSLEAKDPAAGEFGTMMQTFRAGDYRGKRVLMSGWVKTKDVERSTQLWMRVDGATKSPLAFDNMDKRPIKGTSDWKKYEIVLDVPDDGVLIAFGVMLAGKGRVWVDDFKFETVDKTVPVTDMKLKPEDAKIEPPHQYPKQPANLDFEKK